MGIIFFHKMEKIETDFSKRNSKEFLPIFHEMVADLKKEVSIQNLLLT